MAKNRLAVTCNGRAAFYACMWNDIRQCAMDNGWAVALHGSLNSDMDIMTMPWVEDVISFEELVKKNIRVICWELLCRKLCYNLQRKTTQQSCCNDSYICRFLFRYINYKEIKNNIIK